MTQRIGIITNDPTRVFQHDIIQGVFDVVNMHQIEVMIEESINAHPAHSTKLPLSDLDGILVIANVLQDSALQTLYEMGKPITLVSHRVPQLPIPAVIQNNDDGMSKLVDHLIQQGRTSIVFVRGDMNQHDGIQRDKMFRRVVMRHNLVIPETHILDGDFETEVASQALTTFLAKGLQFDAVLAADYLMGCACLSVLKAHHFNIPQMVSVVGFGDGVEAQEAGLTTVGSDVVELGRRATRQLIAQIKGMRMTGVTWLNTELIERASSQAPLKRGLA